MFPVKLPAFFNWKSVPDNMIPFDAVKDAPVSEFTDVIVNVVTPEFVCCEILVAPVATNLKSPAATALFPEASLVTVSVSTLSIVIVC